MVVERRRRGRIGVVGWTIGLPGAALTGVAGYLTVLTATAWWARRKGATRTALPPEPVHRFAVLIPAHNEEQLIGSALLSMAALDYPAALVDVHVVADNCTDSTASVVRAHGVEVHERIAPDDGGKGPALQWLLQRLRDRGETYEAVVILDADTTASPNLLRVMDAKLAEGAEVVQAYYAVREAEESATAGFRAAALAVRHYLRPLARTQLGGSAGLYGNGMALSAGVLARHGWTNHLTEDIEFQLELLLAGTPVAFAPDGVVEAEMPATVEASRSQHERWERGRLEMAQRYGPRLVRAGLSAPAGQRAAYFDAAVDQLLPPFSVLVAATTVWSGIVLVRAVVAPRHRASAVVAVGLLAAMVGHVVTALRLVDAPASVYRSLLVAPRLVAWKVVLWLRVLVRPDDVAWVRTARNAELDAVAPEPGPVATAPSVSA